ncbi:MAG TPA: hypothetical protein VK506_00995, partial [Conexibacter sp.]|nr:hypothetical protein [Conexibacter sp.]
MTKIAARGCLLLVSALAGSALGAPDDAAAARRPARQEARGHQRQHRAKPRIVVRVQPQTIAMGGAAKVAGRVRRLPRRLRDRLRIDVQRQRGSAFVRGGSGRLGRRGRFTLRFRAPRAPQTLVLRLRLHAGGRRLAISETWQVLVHRRTRVLSPADVTAAPPPGAAGDVRVNGRSPVQAGNVIAAGVGPATPYGLL